MEVEGSVLKKKTDIVFLSGRALLNLVESFLV